jgi:biotin carboxylase
VEKYFWIIGGGLLQIPLIAEAKKFDLKIIVSDLSDSCACSQLCDIFVNKDIFDIEGHIEEAKNLISQGKEIVGVLAAGIDAPETMAALAKSLNLPAVDPEIANLVHNKHKFREKLKELGYPMPKFAAVSKENIDKLESIVDKIGFPLIVKNSDSSGSRGTKIFREKNIAEIRDMVDEAIKVSKSAISLIEECWEGPEQTVETIFDVDGNFHPCFITDRIFDRSSGYAMELGLRNPSSLPAKTQEEMYAIAEKVSSDLGVKIGASKFDMILTEKGPRIIEMTVRLSGGFDCQYLVPAATGKKVMQAAIMTALGQKLTEGMLDDTKHRIGLSESVWPEPGKIVKIEGVEEAKKIPGVEHIFFRNKIGDIVLPYTDCTKRVCFILVTGKDETEAKETMEKAKETINIQTESV